MLSYFLMSIVAFIIFGKDYARQGKILPGINLKKRCVIVIQLCFVCKGNEESVDFLLLCCVVASSLWQIAISLFGLLCRLVVDLLVC